MGTRLNARIDDRLARKVALVQHQTQKPMTDILKESLERYCDAALAEPTTLKVFEDAGFVGCAQGPPELSVSYKTELARSLEKKR